MRSELDQHPDILKRRPVDISEDAWERHLDQVREITTGIRYVLRTGVAREELNDIVQEAQVFLLARPDENPYYTGRRMATKWLRTEFQGEFRTKSISDLSRFDDEGNEEMFEDTFGTAPEDVRPDHPNNRDRCSVGGDQVSALLACKKGSPEDCAVVVKYMTRKGTPGNRFTRAESSEYEKAVRRLRKLIKAEVK